MKWVMSLNLKTLSHQSGSGVVMEIMLSLGASSTGRLWNKFQVHFLFNMLDIKCAHNLTNPNCSQNNENSCPFLSTPKILQKCKLLSIPAVTNMCHWERGDEKLKLFGLKRESLNFLLRPFTHHRNNLRTFSFRQPVRLIWV